MKKLILILAVLVIIPLGITYAQTTGVAINATGASGDPSAMLDVSSLDKGVLIPRITNSQRGMIINPANGLMVYQTDQDTGFYYNAGLPTAPVWIQLMPNPAVNDLNMNFNKITNLATCTQNPDAANKEYVDNAVAAGGGGSGMPTMISDESPTNLNVRQAADYCRNLTEGGFTDWYMPTLQEFWYVVSRTDYPIPNDASTNSCWVNTSDFRIGYPYYYGMVRIDNSSSGNTYESYQPWYRVRCVR